MSPKASQKSPASMASSAPYPRRGQSKSSRQQFSACGACRMRRVRCNLKDLALASNGVRPLACSNCTERGIKCVDEFADVKAVKLLRRGRRLQQVEQVYGKMGSKEATSSSPTTTRSSSTVSDQPPNSSIIPQLHVEFFASPFFARFIVQHSLLDPEEFASRYFAHVKGNAQLAMEGQLLAAVLSVWAASFGVDESGVGSTFGQNYPSDCAEGRSRRESTNKQVEELLRLVDLYGVLRKPTWDGVRVLMLVWPLTQEVQTPIQRITMYESILSHIYALCNMETTESVHSGQGLQTDALVRARLFWYAHVHEGTTNALRGGRLVLNNDDLIAFQRTLPPRPSANSTSPQASIPSPLSPTFHPELHMSPEASQSRASYALALATHYFSLTLNVSAICRHIHTVLTGPAARRNPLDTLDEDGLRHIWDGLERCWEDFEAVRRSGLEIGGLSIGTEDLDCFVSSWQIFIFECHNVVREALKQRLVSISSPATGTKSFPSPVSSTSSTPSPDSTIRQHAQASHNCRTILPRVLSILRRQLSVPSSGFFEYDAGLIKDGCFFAGFILAQGDLETEGGCLDLGMDADEGVEIAQHALNAMKWVFSKSDTRQQTINRVWEDRKMRDAERRRSYQAYSDLQHNVLDDRTPPFERYSRFMDTRSQYTPRPQQPNRGQPYGAQTLPVPPTMTHRPLLAPLSLAPTNLRVQSAPNTSSTDNGSWPTYTPPSTGHSHRSSPADSIDSPVSANSLGYITPLQTYKNDSGVFFYGVPELDPYAFSGSASTSSTELSLASVVSQSLNSFPGHHDDYLDPNIFAAGGSVISSPQVIDTCAGFTDTCQTYCH